MHGAKGHAQQENNKEVDEQVAKRLAVRRIQCSRLVAFNLWVATCVLGVQLTADQIAKHDVMPDQNELPRVAFIVLTTAIALMPERFWTEVRALVLHVVLMSLMCFMNLPNDDGENESLSRALLGVSALVVSGLCPRFRWTLLPNVILTAFTVATASEELSAQAVLTRDNVLDVILLAMRLLVLYLVEKTLEFLMRNEVEASFGKCKQTAVFSLLGMMCDAVIELDDSLRCTEHFPKLAAMLMLGSGRRLEGEGLGGHLADEEEQQRLESALRRSANDDEGDGVLTPSMITAGLKDSIGNTIKTVLLLVPYINADGRRHHLIGLREDADSVAPCSERCVGRQQAGLPGAPEAELKPEVKLRLQVPTSGTYVPMRIGRPGGSLASSSSLMTSSGTRGSDGPEYNRSAEVYLCSGFPLRWVGAELQEEFGLEKPKGDGLAKLGEIFPDGGEALLQEAQRCLDKTWKKLGRGRYVKNIGEWTLVPCGGTNFPDAGLSGGGVKRTLWLNFFLPILENDSSTPFVGIAVSRAQRDPRLGLHGTNPTSSPQPLEAPNRSGHRVLPSDGDSTSDDEAARPSRGQIGGAVWGEGAGAIMAL